jgi:hypothetical protein
MDLENYKSLIVEFQHLPLPLKWVWVWAPSPEHWQRQNKSADFFDNLAEQRANFIYVLYLMTQIFLQAIYYNSLINYILYLTSQLLQ